jgi:hypothetical protein
VYYIDRSKRLSENEDVTVFVETASIAKASEAIAKILDPSVLNVDAVQTLTLKRLTPFTPYYWKALTVGWQLKCRVVFPKTSEVTNAIADTLRGLEVVLRES